ncbi:unnamed protein product [Caenorhabditis auriculariae]|uniref:Globin family profile domain-containing protein n=1 Tax=Caenorhabditis auriculariae TaxID=2777116 RepID=A0A8S1HPV1_9PELO|nr:unnamed protein product [Caenorhabditis auriculariae]
MLVVDTTPQPSHTGTDISLERLWMSSSESEDVQHVFRRSLSTRTTSKERLPLRRQRPSTLHVRRHRSTAIPTVRLEESREVEVSGSNDESADRLRVEPYVSRSISPLGRSHVRRGEVLAMLNRIWKSDECTKRGSVQKMKALDIPVEPLTRQLSLSDTNVTPNVLPVRVNRLCLSARQKKLLKNSFNTLNSGGTFMKLMEQIFRRLECKFPDMRSIFLTTAFVNSLSRERSSPTLVRTEHDHCKCMVGIFERIVENLDQVDEQLAMVRQYGQKHAQMAESGFFRRHDRTDVVKFNHESIKAWRLLLASVTDEMKVGYDRTSKIKERRGSCSNRSVCLSTT